jgi:SAM-dependent methyltransferase
MSARTRPPPTEEATRERVRDHYGKIAAGEGCCSSPTSTDRSCASGCCGDSSSPPLEIGYSEDQLASLPEGADLGLGCGNPTALLSLKPGEAVLDLGSGGGIDCFLAAKRVGAKGRAIGVDMTPEMLTKARANARKGGYANVEFRLGEIEHLPVANNSVDVVISNCVINLAPDKEPVYREAFRVLRPGGRFAVSDVVATRPISEKERADLALWSSCASGALEVPQIKKLLKRAGFRDVQVELRRPKEKPGSPAGRATLAVVSADIRASKPRG